MSEKGLRVLYPANQKDFLKIPGNPIGYWMDENSLKCFSNNESLGAIAPASAGLQTGNNSRFLRFFFEVKSESIVG